MRVSIFNCVSTALDMMRYTDEAMFANAGHYDWDYIVVKWLASPAVNRYLADLTTRVPVKYPGVKVHVVEYMTNPKVGYVPNLRGMINAGFQFGFGLNDYAGLVNTDLYCGPGWLLGLLKYAALQRFITGLLLTPVKLDYPGVGFVGVNLGVPEPRVFNTRQFLKIRGERRKDNLILCQDIGGEGGYRQMCMIPYLFHRSWWDKCGPWELTCNWPKTAFDRRTHIAPDMRFFGRMERSGCEFAMTHGCITYHHEKVERTRPRPRGAEHLPKDT